MKVLEEYSTLHNIGVGKDFLNMNQFGQELRSKTDKWDFMTRE